MSSIRQTPLFSDNQASVSSVAQAFAAPVLAGNTILVYVTAGGGSAITVSDSVNGSYGAAVKLVSLPAVNMDLALFAFKNSAAGTPTVTASFSPNAAFVGICIAEADQVSLSKLDQFAYSKQTAPGLAIDAVTTGMTAPLNAKPNLVVALSVDGDLALTPSAGTGYSSLATGWAFSFGVASARIESKNTTSLSRVEGTFTTTDGTHHFGTIVIVLDDLVVPTTYFRPKTTAGIYALDPGDGDFPAELVLKRWF